MIPVLDWTRFSRGTDPDGFVADLGSACRDTGFFLLAGHGVPERLIRDTFAAADTKPWMDKFYSINEEWVADDRRKLLSLARDLLNSDYAGHRLTFQLFAQSPPFAQLAAVYRNFDWNGPLEFAHKAAELSDNVWGKGKLH